MVARLPFPRELQVLFWGGGGLDVFSVQAGLEALAPAGDAEQEVEGGGPLGLDG
jgi:hypothetical protein